MFEKLFYCTVCDLMPWNLCRHYEKMSWLIELMIMILKFDVAWELWLELVPVLCYRNRKGQCDVRTFPN